LKISTQNIPVFVTLIKTVTALDVTFADRTTLLPIQHMTVNP